MGYFKCGKYYKSAHAQPEKCPGISHAQPDKTAIRLLKIACNCQPEKAKFKSIVKNNSGLKMRIAIFTSKFLRNNKKAAKMNKHEA